jgi:hypothetical protein
MAVSLPDKSMPSLFVGFALIAAVVVIVSVYFGFSWFSIGDKGAGVAAEPEGFRGEPARPPRERQQPEGITARRTATAEPLVAEGFYAGPARGSGAPDCLRTSSEGAALFELMEGKVAAAEAKGSVLEAGPDDLRELQVLLGKLACFKRDLIGTAGVVEATRGQPFSTSHDLEAVGETTARCFAKTLPQRDLQLSLDKWGRRGTFLLKRLCTSYGFTETEEGDAMELFGKLMADVGDVAMGRCCNGSVPMIAGAAAPRMVGGYEPPGVYEMREYKGYY